jgi:tRNA(His) 5'-end guanylyltransferase
MKFEDLDKKMRAFETAHDICALPGVFLVARLDGRNFHRLTKETGRFAVPFDEAFRDYMVETVKHLMDCGFSVVYGYTESDEISLLFAAQENSFARKYRKFNSILAGEAAAKFTSILGSPAAFDCRLIELPNLELTLDYFRWRMSDAHRNALNAHCYWRLRAENFSPKEADSRLKGLSKAEKNELLFSLGLNFNCLPLWQKRGLGLYWQTVTKDGFNPLTGLSTSAQRRQIKVDKELPMKAEYDAFLRGLIENQPN